MNFKSFEIGLQVKQTLLYRNKNKYKLTVDVQVVFICSTYFTN